MPVLPTTDGPHRKTLVELCDYIETTLCDLGNLVTGQFPMTQRVVFRGTKRVGIYFCVHGPRSVKLTAIYDYPSRQAIFYGSDGVRSVSVDVQIIEEVSRQPIKMAA